MAVVTVSSGNTISGGVSTDNLVVTGGGTAIGVTVAGGFATVSNGGRASGTVVSNGYLTTAFGGLTSGTVVSSGFLTVGSGGQDIGTTVNSGGYETVNAGGVATDLVVRSGGFAIISGTVNGVTAEKGAGLILYPTASATRLNVLGMGSVDLSYLPFLSGATTAFDPVTDILTISGGGRTETVQLAGDYTGKAFSISSDQSLLTFGKNTPGTVLSISTAPVPKVIGPVVSGDVTVLPGDTASGVVVSGGVLRVASGGVARETTVQFISLLVSSGGVASGTVVQGGMEQVFSGGRDVGTVVKAGSEIVNSGGSATDLVVAAGAQAVISGTVDGVTVNPGGFLNVTTTGSATRLNLLMGASADLAYLPFIAGATTSLDPATDILTISGGGKTETVQLAGDYTGATITTASDAGIVQPLPTSGTIISVTSFASGTPIISGIVTSSGGFSNTVNLAGNNKTIRLEGGTLNFGQGTTGNTAILGSGACTVNDGGSSTIWGGSGADTVIGGAGSSLVIGGTGRLSFTAGTGASTVFAGAGGLQFQGGSGYATVVGLGHAVTVEGGSGGGAYFGGGGGSIHAGSDTATSVLVGAGGDRLSSYGAGGALFGVSATGDVSMYASAGSGNNVFFGANGSGTLTFITGSGNDVLGLGQGRNVVTLGAGHSTVFANTGSSGVSSITVGTGSADIALGGRSVDVVLTAAQASRQVALFNFVPGADTVHLSNYGASAVSDALASQSVQGGSTVLRLSDGSSVSLIGVSTRVDASLFG